MAEPDVAQIFENLSRELSNVCTIVGKQSMSQVIPPFSGKPGEFKLLIKTFKKYGILTGVTDRTLALVAYHSRKKFG
jgi:hypothetical protein